MRLLVKSLTKERRALPLKGPFSAGGRIGAIGGEAGAVGGALCLGLVGAAVSTPTG